ncbi:MAG TPA: hypothetical protein VH206_16255 [Xanthobacteraceae bacterium]|jgi:hypothetical protein|nr:hypothetical protein [Xanthobacteraceae bacterium]
MTLVFRTFTNDLQRTQTPTPPRRKRWTTPRVIVSEVEEAEKILDLVELTLLPTGPS